MWEGVFKTKLKKETSFRWFLFYKEIVVLKLKMPIFKYIILMIYEKNLPRIFDFVKFTASVFS